MIKKGHAGSERASRLYFLSGPSASGTVPLTFRMGVHLACQLTLRPSLETLSQTYRSVLCQFSRWSPFVQCDSQDQPSPSVPSPLSPRPWCPAPSALWWSQAGLQLCWFLGVGAQADPDPSRHGVTRKTGHSQLVTRQESSSCPAVYTCSRFSGTCLSWPRVEPSVTEPS